MLFDILGIILGIFMVLRGADRLTDGAVCIAQRFNMSPIVIGLTVVALGTSMPELFVSITSALQGVTDIAVANVVGSNIFNVLLIAGVAASVAPMTMFRSTVVRDVPVAVVASLLLLLCSLTGEITLWMGLGFLVLLVAYTVFAVKTAKDDDAEELESKGYSMGMSILVFAIGLACLILGSNLFVTTASSLAATLGLSDALIGLTIVAGGTSLPELATSVVAARKGETAIAMGNVLGSCVYNILLIIGFTGVISPLQIEGLTAVDFGMMAGSITLLWLFSYTKYKLERWEGFVLVTLFILYMGYTILQSL